MSWTCPLVWVFRSNLEYPPSHGCQSEPRYMIQVLIWHPTVAGVLEGTTWTMSEILGKPYGYGAQLHLKPHPRHAHISPSFLGPSAKLECTPYPGRWSMVQGGWYRLEYDTQCCMSLWWCICYVWQIWWVKGGLALSPIIPHTHICLAICPGFWGQEVGIYSLSCSWVVE